MSNVGVVSLGCAKNQVDTERMLGLLKAAGHTLTGAQLTLPGVAGLILGIGMAVDANVVIFERIREEVKNGRPIGSAVRKGFSNALSAIIDSNVTTIIAAVVLYAFGTGSVRGFALTLGIGVATSLVTAVFVTHKLLDIFADLGIKNQKLYV